MNPKYCYWSVADGPYGAMMEHCVRTARQAGVFKEFHVLCDRPLEGCECYDAYQCDKSDGLFKLHYLKVGMSRLSFDYFVWLDADTVLTRNPVDPLGPLGKSPIHVPLELNLSSIVEVRSSRRQSTLTSDCTHRTQHFGSDQSAISNPQSAIDQSLVTSATTGEGRDLRPLHEFFRQEGIVNPVYLCGSAFWIIHHDAIDTVYDLALGFWHKGKEAGLILEVSAALGYAMQILCADPEPHLLAQDPDLWASDDAGRFKASLPDGSRWLWQHPLATESIEVRPAIIHLPNTKTLLSGSPQKE